MSQRLASQFMRSNSSREDDEIVGLSQHIWTNPNTGIKLAAGQQTLRNHRL